MYYKHYRDLVKEYDPTPTQYASIKSTLLLYLDGNLYLGVHIAELLPVRDTAIEVACCASGMILI